MEDLTIDQQTLARIFGKSPRTVRRWESDGLDAARVEGDRTSPRYDLATAVQWRIDQERRRILAELSSKNGNGHSWKEARARKERAVAELKELEVLERRRDTVPREEVVQLLRDLAQRVKARILGVLPGPVASDIAAELDVDPGALGALLDKHGRRILADLSENLNGAEEHG